MEPRSDALQRCSKFDLAILPAAKPTARLDHQKNVIHQFDIPGEHTELEIKSESVVDVFPHPDNSELTEVSVWNEIDQLKYHPEFWEFTLPSDIAVPSATLIGLLNEFGTERAADPLTVVRDLNRFVFEAFQYDTEATTVDSPIDDAITNRHGVCQDFSNIMIAMLRVLGIPARYVSGYLFHRVDDRSHVAEDSTHAWVEAYVPGPGWVGFDPTNNIPAGERHIRVAVGRDYADVPPTRGVFKGVVESTLSVAVRVSNAADEHVGSLSPSVIRHSLANASETKKIYHYDDQQ